MSHISPGRRKLVEKIVEHRELPVEVIKILELFLEDQMSLEESEYPELVRALLRAEDDGEGDHKVAGIIFR